MRTFNEPLLLDSFNRTSSALALRCARLMSYPEHQWGVPPSERWVALVDQLREWVPPETVHMAEDRQRKWEIVSAYQKSVRRGWDEWALQLSGATCFWGPEHWRYFWTRITTTACEDVGYGDPELMRFVIACASVFPPSVGERLTRHAWTFLTSRMCDTKRSRIYCQLSLLEDWSIRERVPPPGSLTAWDEAVLNDIRQRSNRGHSVWIETAFHAWHQKKNWRGQNMLKFAVYACPLEPVSLQQEFPPSEVLCGLPDFCYDMHTRVGRRTCRRVCESTALKQFFQAHSTSDKTEAVGWALFLLEGGLVRDGLADQRLSLLEQRYLATRCGWTFATWLSFRQLIGDMLRDGTVNGVRKQVLSEQDYGREPAATQ